MTKPDAGSTPSMASDPDSTAAWGSGNPGPSPGLCWRGTPISPRQLEIGRVCGRAGTKKDNKQLYFKIEKFKNFKKNKLIYAI